MTRPKPKCCAPFGVEVHGGRKTLPGLSKLTKNQIQMLKLVLPNFEVVVNHQMCWLCHQDLQRRFNCLKAEAQIRPLPIVRIRRSSILSNIVRGFRRRSPNTLREAVVECENEFGPNGKFS
jgi:hypothetical protein